MVSAIQDSIASVSDIANLQKNKIFLMQLNDLREDVEKGVFRKNKRIRTILNSNVLNVYQKTSINLRAVLDFLAIETNMTLIITMK